MFLGENAAVYGIAVYYHEYSRQKTVHVPGRPYHSLTYRLSGKITVEVPGNLQNPKLISDAGCLTFIPAGLSYDTEILEDGAMYTLTYVTAGDPPREGATVLKPADTLAFRDAFSALRERFRAGRERDYACFSLFYGILARIEADSRPAELIPKRMLDAKKALDTAYDDPALCVKALAAQCGVSEVYFRRSFRACFGSAPSEYLHKVRIDNAKLLLQAGFYSVIEVAARCGYDSTGYFSCAFKKATGLTPTAYKKRFSLL